MWVRVRQVECDRLQSASATTVQSSGSEAKSFLAVLYHPMPEMGCFHRPFISFRAGWCASSPPATTSFQWASCALMTSSAALPWCGYSQGPPNWLQVMVFIELTFPSSTRSLPGLRHPVRSRLGDPDEIARGVAERAVAHSPRLRRRLLEHLDARTASKVASRSSERKIAACSDP